MLEREMKYTGLMIIMIFICFNQSYASKYYWSDKEMIDSLNQFEKNMRLMEEKVKESNSKFEQMLTISKNSIDMLNNQNDRAINQFLAINAIFAVIIVIISIVFTNVYNKYNKIKGKIDDGKEKIKQFNKDLKKHNADHNKIEKSMNDFDSNFDKINKEFNNIDQKLNIFNQILLIDKIETSQQFNEDDSFKPKSPDEKEATNG